MLRYVIQKVESVAPCAIYLHSSMVLYRKYILNSMEILSSFECFVMPRRYARSVIVAMLVRLDSWQDQDMLKCTKISVPFGI